jgi:hypothetical protein
MLKVGYAPKMNVLGGSWITSLLPTLKDIGKGAYNIVRDVISNKNGIRDKLLTLTRVRALTTTFPSLVAHSLCKVTLLPVARSMAGTRSRVRPLKTLKNP